MFADGTCLYSARKLKWLMRNGDVRFGDCFPIEIPAVVYYKYNFEDCWDLILYVNILNIEYCNIVNKYLLITGEGFYFRVMCLPGANGVSVINGLFAFWL